MAKLRETDQKMFAVGSGEYALSLLASLKYSGVEVIDIRYVFHASLENPESRAMVLSMLGSPAETYVIRPYKDGEVRG